MIKQPNYQVKSISPPQCKGQYVRVNRPSFSPVFHFSSVSASGNRSLFRPAVQGYINAARPCTAKQNRDDEPSGDTKTKFTLTEKML